MATIWHTAWDVVWAVASVCVLVTAIGWLVDWRRGRTSVRDERGRLRPVAAVLVSFGLLFVVSGAAALIA